MMLLTIMCCVGTAIMYLKNLIYIGILCKYRYLLWVEYIIAFVTTVYRYLEYIQYIGATFRYNILFSEFKDLALSQFLLPHPFTFSLSPDYINQQYLIYNNITILCPHWDPTSY